jgi:hypothetical protein
VAHGAAAAAVDDEPRHVGTRHHRPGQWLGWRDWRRRWNDLTAALGDDLTVADGNELIVADGDPAAVAVGDQFADLGHRAGGDLVAYDGQFAGRDVDADRDSDRLTAGRIGRISNRRAGRDRARPFAAIARAIDESDGISVQARRYRTGKEFSLMDKGFPASPGASRVCA